MLEVRLLGQFDVRRNGSAVAIPSRAAQSLFAYLVLTAGTAHRREELAGLLWPDTTEENARKNLRHELWRLRKAIEPQWTYKSPAPHLTINEISIGFNGQSDYWLDVSIIAQPLPKDATVDQLVETLAHYRGELLLGWYDEWVVLEREHIRAVFEQKMARLLELLVEGKRWQETLDWGERWIALGQTPEPAYRALMVAHHALGNMAQVASVYERAVRALRDELGVKPSEQTQSLFERLSKQDETDELPPASPTGPPAAGETRAESRFAPLPSTPPLHFPNPLGSFVGREREIEQVKQLLSSTRLLTLTGTGGIGKTRLAIQVAGDISSPQWDQPIWVDLAALSDSTLVSQAVMKVLKVPDVPNVPPIETLANVLCSRSALLVLDNCEHLIAACAQLAEFLLSRCDSLKILATSRETLGISGETIWRVPSLSLPEPEHEPAVWDLDQFESIQLFVDRARLVKTDFALTEANASAIVRICQRLDGIPLAIELAAARLKLLSPGEIETHLDDRFRLLTAGSRTALPRHQTLRATINWSYDLLTEPERRLFRRLPVFAGGVTLEAAEGVGGGDGLLSEDITSLLFELVAKSLVIVETRGERPTRYYMLETIRQYAREKMREVDRSERLYDLHLEFFLRLAEEAEPHLYSAEAPTWLDRAHDDWNNVRAAIRWSLKRDRGEKGLRIANALAYFAFARGYLREYYQTVLDLLKSQTPVPRTVMHGKGFFSAGVAAMELGNIPEARAHYEESVAILREAGERGRELLETVLSYFAYALQWTEPRKAVLHAEEAVSLCRASGNRDGLALALVRLAEAQYIMSNIATARELLREGGALAQEIGNQFTYLVSQADLGIADLYDGDLDAAEEHLNTFNSPWMKSSRIGPALANTFFGAVARLRGQVSEAVPLLEEAVRTFREIGQRRFASLALVWLGRLELDRTRLEEARRCFVESLALAREANAWVYVAWSLESLAYLSLKLNQPRRAVQFLGVADAWREKLGTPLLPVERKEHEAAFVTAHAQLEPTSFDQAWAEGHALSLEQAMEHTQSLPNDSTPQQRFLRDDQLPPLRAI